MMRLSYLLVPPVLSIRDPMGIAIWRGITLAWKRKVRKLEADEYVFAHPDNGDVGVEAGVERERRIADEINAKPFSHALVIGLMS